MEHEKAVKEALNALYHHPDDTVRVQADRWLQNFQGTLDAWQASFLFFFEFFVSGCSIVLHSLDFEVLDLDPTTVDWLTLSTVCVYQFNLGCG